MDYKEKYLKYKSKYITLQNMINQNMINQHGGNEIQRFNRRPVREGRTFHIYTTGMDYDRSFERWHMYIRNHIIDNLLQDYDRVIIYHSDVLYYIDEGDEDMKISKMFEHEAHVEQDVMHPKVHSSTFTYLPINFQELDARHHGRDYILFDFAHVIQYILPRKGEEYENLVYIKLYGTEEISAPFHLNSVYVGVIGNENHRNHIIMTGRVFSVRDGIVITYIKKLFDNYHHLFARNEMYVNQPQSVYEPMLARVKKELERIWRERYGGLSNTNGRADFDGVYIPLITSDNSPINMILNLYLEDDIQEDTIYEIVLSEYSHVFFG